MEAAGIAGRFSCTGDETESQRPCSWKSPLYCVAGALLLGPASAGPASRERAAMAANVIFFNMVVLLRGFEIGTWFSKRLGFSSAFSTCDAGVARRHGNAR